VQSNNFPYPKGSVKSVSVKRDIKVAQLRIPRNSYRRDAVGQGFGRASRASARLFRAEARNAAPKGCPTGASHAVQLLFRAPVKSR